MAKLNHNVRACLLLCVLSGVADSTWSGTVIAAFILIASGSNTTVGLVEAAQGLATLLFALPIGYLADRYGRAGVISTGGVLCVCAAAATTYVILGVERDAQMSSHSIGVLFAVMIIWGVVGGIISGPAQALYADSIPTGERSKWYVYLFGAYIVSSAIGPTISIAVFALSGDQWTLGELRLVILCGMAAEVGCALVMCTFSDKEALGQQSEAIGARAAQPADGPGLAAAEEAAPEGGAAVEGGAAEEASHAARAPAADAPAAARESSAPAAAQATGDVQSPPAAARHPSELGRGALSAGAGGVRRIPYVLFASSLLSALGSGMSVKFFPLFFARDCKLSPEGTQAIYVAVPFAMVCCSALVQRASVSAGRVQCIVVSRALGVGLLLVMAWLQLRSEYKGAALVLVPVYVLRTALMNSGYPLEESILMDYVPKSSRARWKSLESISQFGWCGSAALGGWLGDRFGYSYTFLLTAAVQGTATLLVATLLPVVPRREADGARLVAAEGAAAGQGEPVAPAGGEVAVARSAVAAVGTAAAPSGGERAAAKPVRRNLPLSLQEPLLDPTADAE